MLKKTLNPQQNLFKDTFHLISKSSSVIKEKECHHLFYKEITSRIVHLD